MTRKLVLLFCAFCFCMDLSAVPSGYAPVLSNGAQFATVGVAFSHQITATASPQPSVYNATGLPGGLTVNSSTGVISGKPTTAGNFNATVSASNTYGTGSATLTINVARGSQTIQFVGLPDRVTYGGKPIQLSATASSGLTVTFSVQSGPATVSGNTLNITGAGTVVVAASQAGDANYMPAASVTKTLVVDPATATITLTDTEVLFDGNPKQATVSTTPKGLKVVVLYDGEETPVSTAGNHSVTATIDEQNYTGSASGTLLIGYQLDAKGVYGSIIANPSAAVYAPGAIVTLRPGTPSSTDRAFSRWMGDVAAVNQSDNPLQVVMDDHKTILANFTPNLAAPSGISASPSYFSDSVASGTEVATLSTTDSDTGDTFIYTFAEGVGDYSNSRFTILGDKLLTADTFSGDDMYRAGSVRIRSTDAAGHFIEAALPLHLVDATPDVCFTLKSGFADSFYVNAIFRLTGNIDSAAPYANGHVDYPTAYIKQHPELFRISEDGTPVSPIEASPHVGTMGEIPTMIQTVLLIDNSASMGGVLNQVREAAKLMVASMLPNQRTAVYTFSNTLAMVQDYTNDPALLNAALDSIQVGSATTDLNGAVLDALDLWTDVFPDSFPTDKIMNEGYLVIVSDGNDQAGRKTLEEVLTKRDSADKRITAVGLAINTDEMDGDELARLGNAGYSEALVNTQSDNGNLKRALADVQLRIEEDANSIYWLRYVSPKRGNALRTVEIALSGNENDDPATMKATFTVNSDLFSDVQRGIVIDPSVKAPRGITGPLYLSEGSPLTLEASVFYGLTNPEFEWIPDDQRFLTVTDLSVDGSRRYVSLVPHVPSGTVQLTVRDAASIALAEANHTGIDPAVYEKTLTVVIGSGEEPETDSPWPTATDLANDWIDSSWFGLCMNYYFPWVWSAENGWIWSDFGDEKSGMYFYDTSLGCWEWTSEDFYPWIYAFDPYDGWLWIQPGGKPGKRVFYVNSIAGWLTEAALIRQGVSK